jgi:YihY family inner membrane protein
MQVVSTQRDLPTVARRVVDEVREAEVTFLAASLAYYAFSSLIPLLVLGIVVAAFVGGAALRARVGELAGQYLVPTATDLVNQALANQTGQGGVGLVGLLIVTWGALKIFRGLDTAFSKIYGTPSGSILDQVRDGIVALVGIGAGVFAVTAASAAIAVAPVPFVDLLAPVLLLLTLVAAFLPIYYVFPDADVSVREVLPGAVFAAVGWTVLSAAFGVYADYATSEGSAALYGVLGAVLLLVTWFYLGGLVLLTGAVVNAVLAGRSPDRGTDADAGAGAGPGGTGRDGGAGREAADGTARGEEPSTGGGPAGAGRFRGRDRRRAASADRAGADRASGGGGVGVDGPGRDPDRSRDGDRKLRQGGDRQGRATDMSDAEDTSPDPDSDEPREREPRGAADISQLEDRIDEVRADLDAFETDVRERTVDKPDLEAELRRYVRRRLRRGKATGWGPYLVLLYGTVMTLGAFYFLRGIYAILAMLVLFLSTLGLYVVFVAVGLGLNALSVPGRAYDAVQERRE